MPTVQILMQRGPGTAAKYFLDMIPDEGLEQWPSCPWARVSENR